MEKVCSSTKKTTKSCRLSFETHITEMKYLNHSVYYLNYDVYLSTNPYLFLAEKPRLKPNPKQRLDPLVFYWPFKGRCHRVITSELQRHPSEHHTSVSKASETWSNKHVKTFLMPVMVCLTLLFWQLQQFSGGPVTVRFKARSLYAPHRSLIRSISSVFLIRYMRDLLGLWSPLFLLTGTQQSSTSRNLVGAVLSSKETKKAY